MLPLRLFRVRAFAVGNATTFLMTGAIFAAAFFVTQEFQLALRLLAAGHRRAAAPLLRHADAHLDRSPAPSPTASAAGRSWRAGLLLQTAGFVWVALEARARASSSSSSSRC